MDSKMIITSYTDFLNENLNNYNFTDTQRENAYNLFKEVFDYYLRKTEPDTYPMIYHCTEFERYESIKKYGLTKYRNYFQDNDNNMFIYGFDEDDNEVPGISCGVNYKDVIHRLYPDPEWLHDILEKTGNPSRFEAKKIDDSIIHCLLVTEVLKLDINEKLTLKSISRYLLNDIMNTSMFHWLYVKGKVQPELLTIKIHPDLN